MSLYERFMQRSDHLFLNLRALYESYGYSKFRMDKFEAYDTYMRNREFIIGDGIVTFTDRAGRLMALKPDVTISIVNSVKDDGSCEKYYYNENVFRYEPGAEDLREIAQIGIEYIGAEGAYAEAEVLLLAAKTLEQINDGYVLDISHMGFISALMEAMRIPEGKRGEFLSCLRGKNCGGLMELSDRLSLGADCREVLEEVAGMGEDLGAGIGKALGLNISREADGALRELSRVSEALSHIGASNRLRLDFSVINDLDYYNGIIFRGYVKEAPRAVLAGGRYDNLLKKIGKPQAALGFALYLSELDRAFFEPKEYDVDLLLIYGDAPPESVLKEVELEIQKGKTVRAERTAPEHLRAKETKVLEVR